MPSTTIAVDLAKNVFELAVATPTFRIVERKRLTRSRFERLWSARERSRFQRLISTLLTEEAINGV